MRRLAIVLLLASAGSLAAAKPRAAPASATSAPVTPEHVTVGQLDQMLASLNQRRDADAARAIAALELTERPSRDEVERWEGKLPGKHASEALCALTDAAAFLNPPTADLPADPPPEIATQNQIVARAQDYVIHTLHKLPNFSALRHSTGFELAAKGEPPASRLDSIFSVRRAQRRRVRIGPSIWDRRAPSRQGASISTEFGSTWSPTATAARLRMRLRPAARARRQACRSSRPVENLGRFSRPCWTTFLTARLSGAIGSAILRPRWPSSTTRFRESTRITRCKPPLTAR